VAALLLRLKRRRLLPARGGARQLRLLRQQRRAIPPFKGAKGSGSDGAAAAWRLIGGSISLDELGCSSRQAKLSTSTTEAPLGVQAAAKTLSARFIRAARRVDARSGMCCFLRLWREEFAAGGIIVSWRSDGAYSYWREGLELSIIGVNARAAANGGDRRGVAWMVITAPSASIWSPGERKWRALSISDNNNAHAGAGDVAGVEGQISIKRISAGVIALGRSWRRRVKTGAVGSTLMCSHDMISNERLASYGDYSGIFQSKANARQ